jgi:hypothetical protein
METDRILPLDKPVDVDRKLIHVFGISLYWFAISLARVLSSPQYYDPRRRTVKGISYYEFCRSKISKLRLLKDSLLRTLSELEAPDADPFGVAAMPIIMLSNFNDNRFPKWFSEKSFLEPTEEWKRDQINDAIEEKYKIKAFIESVDQEISSIIDYLKDRPARGNPMKLRNVVVADWLNRLKVEYRGAKLMDSRADRTLLDLVRWFYGNLASSLYGQWLKEKDDRKHISVLADGTTEESDEFGFGLEQPLVQKHMKKYQGNPPGQRHTVESKADLKSAAGVFDLQIGTVPFLNKYKTRLIEPFSFRVEFNKRVIIFRYAVGRNITREAHWVKFPNGQTLCMGEVLGNYYQSDIEATNASHDRVMCRAIDMVTSCLGPIQK